MNDSDSHRFTPIIAHGEQMNIQSRPWCRGCLCVYQGGIIISIVWMMIGFFVPIDEQRIVHQVLLFYIIIGVSIGFYVAERLWREKKGNLTKPSPVCRWLWPKNVKIYIARAYSVKTFTKPPIMVFIVGWTLSCIIDSNSLFIATLMLYAMAESVYFMKHYLRMAKRPD